MTEQVKKTRAKLPLKLGKPLTPKLRRILRFIAYRCLCGSPPSIRAIGKEFGINSPNGVLWNLDALERRGLIEVERGTAKGVRVVGCEILLQYTDDEAGRRLQEALEYEDQEEQEAVA